MDGERSGPSSLYDDDRLSAGLVVFDEAGECCEGGVYGISSIQPAEEVVAVGQIVHAVRGITKAGDFRSIKNTVACAVSIKSQHACAGVNVGDVQKDIARLSVRQPDEVETYRFRGLDR